MNSWTSDNTALPPPPQPSPYLWAQYAQLMQQTPPLFRTEEGQAEAFGLSLQAYRMQKVLNRRAIRKERVQYLLREGRRIW